jgi:putative ABC transport system permease protein
MNLWRLARRNIAGSSYRSSVVFLCALVVAGLALSTILIVRGASESLRLASLRLGADIVVVAEGTESKVESALLMGTPASAALPRSSLQKIAAVPGVAAVSPQLYLSSLKNASCCSASEMFLVAFDPATDFTVSPWLEKNLGGKLRLGEAVGGTYVFTPEGEQNIRLYGYFITLKGNLEPTGTNLDRSMFFTLDTANDMARVSKTMAEEPLQIAPDTISAALVKLGAGTDVHDVAARIMQNVPGVMPIESPNLFLAFRRQISGLLGAMLGILSITGILSLVLIGLVLSMAANERRREMGVLKALGATRGFVFKVLVIEAGMLALAGALPGLALAALTVYLFRSLIIRGLGVPFLYPSPLQLLGLIGACIIGALVGVTLAAAYPAWRVSREDAAISMRE